MDKYHSSFLYFNKDQEDLKREAIDHFNAFAKVVIIG